MGPSKYFPASAVESTFYALSNTVAFALVTVLVTAPVSAQIPLSVACALLYKVDGKLFHYIGFSNGDSRLAALTGEFERLSRSQVVEESVGAFQQAGSQPSAFRTSPFVFRTSPGWKGKRESWIRVW